MLSSENSSVGRARDCSVNPVIPRSVVQIRLFGVFFMKIILKNLYIFRIKKINCKPKPDINLDKILKHNSLFKYIMERIIVLEK